MLVDSIKVVCVRPVRSERVNAKTGELMMGNGFRYAGREFHQGDVVEAPENEAIYLIKTGSFAPLEKKRSLEFLKDSIDEKIALAKESIEWRKGFDQRKSALKKEK